MEKPWLLNARRWKKVRGVEFKLFVTRTGASSFEIAIVFVFELLLVLGVALLGSKLLPLL